MTEQPNNPAPEPYRYADPTDPFGHTVLIAPIDARTYDGTVPVVSVSVAVNEEASDPEPIVYVRPADAAEVADAIRTAAGLPTVEAAVAAAREIDRRTLAEDLHHIQRQGHALETLSADYVRLLAERDKPAQTPDREQWRQQIADALHDAGAYCGECNFETDSKTCAECIKVRGWYADAVLPVLDAAVTAAVRRALEDAADGAEELRQFEKATGWQRAAAQVSENVGVLRVSDWLRLLAADVSAPAREQGEAQPVISESDYNAAWNAVEGAAGDEGSDPGTILHAVLDALGIDYSEPQLPATPEPSA